MDRSTMEDFVSNAALLAGHLTQQCNKAAAAQQSAAADLRRVADDVSQRVVAGKQELVHAARAAVREALAQEISEAVAAVGQSGDRLRTVAEQLQRERAMVSGRMRMLGLGTLGALAIASFCTIGATAYVASNNLKRAERANVDAQVLEALAHVAITSCDGTPCIKLAEGQARWTKNDDYILVDASAPRGPAAP